MTQEYARHVQSRGLRLAGAWLTPPFERSDADSELTVVWEYPTLGALWAARMAEEDDPVVRDIWAKAEKMTTARSRQLARSWSMDRSEEHTSELQSLMRISYAVFCLKKKKIHTQIQINVINMQS